MKRATESKQKTEEAQKEEERTLKDLEFYTKNAEGVVAWDEDKKVNVPQLSTGMTKIMFTEPTGTDKGTVIKEGESGFLENGWYSYVKSDGTPDKKWANVQTEDGSMWVWIPRFAYRVNNIDKTIEVRFLIGTTDNYYEGTEIKTAQRQKTKDDAPINTVITTEAERDTVKFTVHPAFTNETNIDIANGGWDKEISGIWVAKFEAGFAGGNNTVEAKDSTVKFSQNGTNMYGSYTSDTAIKYPVFQGITYSMNYININDAFNISRALTEKGNIYGLTSITDSHLMKNSEWGACAYLGRSQYGLGSTDITVNNITLNNGINTIYAVTGVTSDSASNGQNIISENVTTYGESMKNVTGNTAVSGTYAWNQATGTSTSTTGTIYGVYDMSGGTWERTASYVPNSNGNLKSQGESVTWDTEKNELRTKSTKYTMAYSDYNAETDKPGITDESGSSTNLDIASRNNWTANTKIYGDAVRETSSAGTGGSPWYSDYSYYPALDDPFFGRGGGWSYSTNAGLFAFGRHDGNSYGSSGFRPVLVVV